MGRAPPKGTKINLRGREMMADLDIFETTRVFQRGNLFCCELQQLTDACNMSRGQILNILIIDSSAG